MADEVDATALRQAVASLIDIVEEISHALAEHGIADREWCDVVSTTLATHRKELRILAPGG